MRRRADLTRRPEDPRGLLLAEHPHQNTQPQPTGPLGVPGEVWQTCQPSRHRQDQSRHFLCRGEYREWATGDGFKPGSGPWRVCACWCHYLLALDREPPRRVCQDCQGDPLQYLGVLWPGISEWEGAHLCRGCLTRRRRNATLSLEIGGTSGGPALKMEWMRTPVSPAGRLFEENRWPDQPSYEEEARGCPQGHGPKVGCPQCKTKHLRLLWRLDITGYGAWGDAYLDPLLAEGTEPWRDDLLAPQLAGAVGGGEQQGLF